VISAIWPKVRHGKSAVIRPINPPIIRTFCYKILFSLLSRLEYPSSPSPLNSKHTEVKKNNKKIIDATYSSPDPVNSQITHLTIAVVEVEMVEQQQDCTVGRYFAGNTDTAKVEGAVVADNSAMAPVGQAVPVHTDVEDLAVHTAAKAILGWGMHTGVHHQSVVEALVELKASGLGMLDLVFPVGGNSDLSACVARVVGSFDLLACIELVGDSSDLLVFVGPAQGCSDLSAFVGPAGGNSDLLAFVGQAGDSMLVVKHGTLLLWNLEIKRKNIVFLSLVYICMQAYVLKDFGDI
jgi:hypothetical protein